MMAYFWWGLAIIVIAVLVWLVVYATKAGRNAQSVDTSKQAEEDAQIVTSVQANMAKAQADGPQDKDQLLQRLDEGNA